MLTDYVSAGGKQFITLSTVLSTLIVAIIVEKHPSRYWKRLNTYLDWEFNIVVISK